MTRGRTVLLLIVTLFAVATVYHASRPSLCEPSRASMVEVWLYRIQNGITGAERLCVPWKDKTVTPLTTSIAFEEWYTSVSGPVWQRYAIGPDGTGYIQHDPEGWSKVPPGFDAEGKFRFRDRRAYAVISELLAPLRGYTLAEPSGSAKLLPICRETNNYSVFRIYWSGDFERQSESSAFEIAQGRCPALQEAMRRLNRARRILELKVNPELREQLLRGPDAPKQAAN